MHINRGNLPKKILSWYDNNKRILPWRISQKSHRKHYYRILSEIMLQQTQVKTVIPYFKNFVNKIPNLKTLSKINSKKILKLWEGLGYYRRAKNLHKTAKILIKRHSGKLPKQFEEVKKLPGIGEYTANALLALIYNQPRIPFDGNIKRLFFRLFDVQVGKNQNEIKSIIRKKFYTKRNGDLAEALMEFGAVICKPINPICSECNLKRNCLYFKNKTLSTVKKKYQKKEKKYNIYCYLKKRKKEIALTKNKNLSFLYDFKIPDTKLITRNKKNYGWIYLCNYKNNVSNIKMNINLFYKFTKNKPEKYTWYPIDKKINEFMPSFTKKIFEKIAKVYA